MSEVALLGLFDAVVSEHDFMLIEAAVGRADLLEDEDLGALVVVAKVDVQVLAVGVIPLGDIAVVGLHLGLVVKLALGVHLQRVVVVVRPLLTLEPLEPDGNTLNLELLLDGVVA